ncbi:MAG TPA: chemotaxis protein CheA [Gemmatimonadaceae bacterium]|nr:chemotaxis protein CheA [Gemmatimonadaceae bacterium]
METARYADLFLSESREHLSEINNALLKLERGGSDGGEAPVAELFRAVHSMKGMSAAMGYHAVTELSHELESLFDKLRDGSVVVTPVVMETLFAATDALEEAVALATQAEPRALDIAEMMVRLRSIYNEDHPQTFTSEFQVMAGNRGETAAPTVKAARHIRIDARRLDTLMNVVGELVIVRDRLTQMAEQIGDAALVESTVLASQLVSTLQNEIMTSRMVPVWQVFDRFPRVVRDTAHSLGKEVEFMIEGKDIELDRSMLDEMGEPVLHLLRNALDHGVELPHERAAAGKSPVALLTLSAERDRATVLIRVVDDGRGIEAERVLPRAIQLGLIDPDTKELTEEELVRVISKAGFSTASRVSDLSGRGVGFDVVASKVRALGGSLEVRTEAGKGTSVSMRLPLTLAISRALLARVEKEIYAIPLTHVVETFALSAPMLQTVKGREVLTIRDDVFPAIRLREHVGLPEAATSGTGQVVLVELADRRAALIVDEFVGQQEIVVKQFDSVKGSPTLFSGATILGDGAAALIIDASTLL